MNNSLFFTAKPRVLVVDNNESIRNIYRELIAYWGFEPVLAHGLGNALLEDAKRKARECRCQLAVIDLRLVDDLDEEDTSGLRLVPGVRPAISIVVSASVDIENVRLSLSDEIGAASYVGKGEGPEILKDKLEREARKLCAARKEITIEPYNLLAHINATFGKSLPDIYKDQIADLFVRLFPQARHLYLEKLEGGPPASPYSTAPRPKSVILKVYEDGKQPVIVKVARAEKMSVEVERYQKYIHGYLKGYFHPLLSNPVVLWDIGGAIYTSLGHVDSQTFSRFYHHAPFPDIEYSLAHFFRETWSPLYINSKQCKNVSLFDEYCKVWGKEWYDRIVKFHFPKPADFMGIDLTNKITPIDPLKWLQEKIGHAIEDDQSITDSTALAVTHGDLHGDNLLIDEHHNAWVIDFERSGEGHILQDFVELEGDIINRLISGRENLPSFYQLCLDVTQSKELKKLEDIERFEDPDVKKSIQTISLLRQLAQETTGIADARQYLLGLLFNTLFRATISGDAARTLSQHRALMLASIICHRLDHWNDPWPPEEWNAITKVGKR